MFSNKLRISDQHLEINFKLFEIIYFFYLLITNKISNYILIVYELSNFDNVLGVVAQTRVSGGNLTHDIHTYIHN